MDCTATRCTIDSILAQVQIGYLAVVNSKYRGHSGPFQAKSVSLLPLLQDECIALRKFNFAASIRFSALLASPQMIVEYTTSKSRVPRLVSDSLLIVYNKRRNP